MPPPKLTISEWADQYRVLAPESSAESGKWRTERAEFQRGMMDAISDPSVEKVVIMSSSQVGKSECLLNTIGYFMSYDPCPILMLQPTIQMAQAFSKDRIAPMIRLCPTLKNKVKDPRARDSGNTVLQKLFPGGHLSLAASNSPAQLASRPIRVFLADEVDRFPPSAGAEGDPLSLGVKRTLTFLNRKIVVVSTPTNKGASRIEAAFLESDQSYFYVPCKNCNSFQRLRWPQVRWPEGHPEEAQYECEFCQCRWSDRDRWLAVKKGKWLSTADSRIKGFHISELYSPWSKLGGIAEAFYEAKAFPEMLKTWVNTCLGETWEEETDRIDEMSLQSREEDFPEKHLPEGVRVITAGVDTQTDRIEVLVLGWGDKEECWVLEHDVIRYDPATPEAWNQLDRFLKKEYFFDNGAKLPIFTACVDTGGSATQMAYKFCSGKHSRRVYAIKGRAGKEPLWPKRATKNNVERVNLYLVGVDTGKEMIYSRLKLTEGAGMIHFPKGKLDAEFYRQLCSEQVITRFLHGFPIRSWELRKGYRNEVLDMFNYALAALHSCRIDWSTITKPDAPLYPEGFLKNESESEVVKRSKFVSGGRKGRWI